MQVSPGRPLSSNWTTAGGPDILMRAVWGESWKPFADLRLLDDLPA
jgi:hypothetical protein